MRKALPCLFVFGAMLLAAPAQVTVDITCDQEQFISGETIPLAVRVTNRSGQTLRLGEQPDWLTFSVESLESSTDVVAKLAEVPVQGGFDLPPSKTAVKRVDLQPYFALALPGRYNVTTTLRIPGWNRETASPPKLFYVIEGARMWEREVGLPNTGTNGIPEVRKYILQQATYIKGQLKLYLRVTDASGMKTLKVQPIGRILSFSHPEPQVDRESKLHLVYQSGPGNFTYLLFDPDGEILKRETYDYTNSRPRLKGNDDGSIAVVGGTRRITKDDVPAPVPGALLEYLTNSATQAPVAQPSTNR